jgi:ubiquinone/menaquinone biosynthesis C-methylase UbiE
MHDGIFDVKKAYKLDNPERVKNLKPVEILKDIAKVSDGETCVDFGSGTGVFALPMAELVGDTGRVYAVDSSPEMHEHIRAKNLRQSV